MISSQEIRERVIAGAVSYLNEMATLKDVTSADVDRCILDILGIYEKHGYRADLDVKAVRDEIIWRITD